MSGFIGKTRIVRREIPPARPFLRPLPAVLARICSARRIASADELEHSLERLEPYRLLSGLEPAVRLLEEAIRERWRILVVGDFDADGATSTALMVRALESMGAHKVAFLVPNRFEYGYGLTPEIVAVAAERRPDLIVTVDNGISSVDGVAAAKAAGIKVLITDHHLPGERLPDADAIVNPNQPGDRFAVKALAGVGVAFYVMLALRGHLREQGRFDAGSEPNLAQFLDLVALGTVADVVPMVHTNRILVAQGLARIRAGRGSPGIRALARVAGRDPARLVSTDLGYAIGPRLNAAGRMDDMSLGIRCLLAQDEAEAIRIAQALDALNRERRSTEAQMREQAMAELHRMQLESRGELPVGLCLFDPGWHEGVIGILASRIKERVHRPVVVFTEAGDGRLKGSARSVQGVHIRDALDIIAARHPDLLAKFGGHAMAAGLTIEREALDAFRDAFDAVVRESLSADELEGLIHSDGELSADEMTLDTAELIRFAFPWGQGFPEPVFDGEFEVVSHRVVGELHLKLLLRLPEDRGGLWDAIVFNADLEAWAAGHERVHLAYRLDINEYGGRRTLQFIVEHLEPVEEVEAVQ